MSGDADTRLQDLAAEAATKIAALNDQRLREAIEAGRDWYLLVRPDLKESVSTIIRDETGKVVCITADAYWAPPRTKPLDREQRRALLQELDRQRTVENINLLRVPCPCGGRGWYPSFVGRCTLGAYRVEWRVCPACNIGGSKPRPTPDDDLPSRS